MAYKNKTYVAFDGDNDIRYYNLMKAWKQNDNSNFNFFDAHDINNALDSSTEETIKKRLRERMANSKVFVLLVGESTRYLYKFVRWEIEQAIKRELPIIVVNLNNKKSCDNDLCPALAKNTLAIHIPFSSKIMQYALENWPQYHEQYKRENKTGAFYYKDDVYKSLGI
jgi:sugar-specific transcriptional regulator TrmB